MTCIDFNVYHWPIIGLETANSLTPIHRFNMSVLGNSEAMGLDEVDMMETRQLIIYQFNALGILFTYRWHRRS